jgi:hypothetical protein
MIGDHSGAALQFAASRTRARALEEELHPLLRVLLSFAHPELIAIGEDHQQQEDQEPEPGAGGFGEAVRVPSGR